MSGKNESRNEGEDATFAQEAERKSGRSTRGSRSKSRSRDGSTLKGLVEGVGAAGSSNAGGRASFVGFSVLLERAGAFFAVVFCVSVLSVVGEGRSSAEERERLPLPLSGVRAERSVKVLMLAVCAMPVWAKKYRCSNEGCMAVYDRDAGGAKNNTVERAQYEKAREEAAEIARQLAERAAAEAAERAEAEAAEAAEERRRSLRPRTR